MLNGEKMKIDIRKIKLSKRDDDGKGSELQWYAFDHYDGLEVTQVEPQQDEHFLVACRRDAYQATLQAEGASYQHSVIAFSLDDDNDEFWGREAPLFLVTTVHCKLYEDMEPIKAFDCIKKQMTSILLEVASDGGSLAKGVANVSFALYFALNCNDMVIFWKSNSFRDVQKILTMALDGYKKGLGENYPLQATTTICAVDRRICENNQAGIGATLLNEWQAREEKLERVVVYCRALQYELLRNLMKEMHEELPNCVAEPQEGTPSKDGHYQMFGEEDACIIITDVTPEQLMRLYKKDQGQLCPDVLRSKGIFCRTSLRFQIHYVHQEQITDDPKPDSALKMYQRLQGLLSKNELSIARYPWLNSLVGMFRQVSLIERNPYCVDIYIQVIYPLKLFLEQFEQFVKLCKDNERDLDYYVEDVRSILRFARGWSQLSFHAEFAEKHLIQLTHSSVLYDFPAKLGAFYTAFWHEIAQLLSTSDGSHEKGYGFLITPKLCSEAYFRSIFRSLRPGDRCILGEIPAHLMYDPKQLLIIGTHEATHFCGSAIRRRQERFSIMADCVIFFIIHRLYEGYFSEKQIVALMGGFHFIIENAEKAMNVRMKCNSQPSRDFYMDESVLQLKETFSELLCKSKHTNLMPVLIRQASQMQNGGGDEDFFVDDKMADLEYRVGYKIDSFFNGVESRYRTLEEFLVLLRELFCESLCDVIMGTLIPISLSDYLDVFLASSGVGERLESIENLMRHSYARDRIQAVVMVMNRSRDVEICERWKLVKCRETLEKALEESKNDEDKLRWKKKLVMLNALVQGGDNKQYYLHTYCMERLTKYLEDCKDVFIKQTDRVKRDRLRKLYEVVANPSSARDFYQEVLNTINIFSRG